MKNTSRQRSVRPPAPKHIHKVSSLPAPPLAMTGICTAPANHSSQLTIEPTPHPIRIHAGQQNLPRPALLSLPEPNPPPAAQSAFFRHSHKPQHPPPPRPTPSIDRHNHRLRPKAPANLPNQLRPRNRTRVDAHLIGPCIEHRRRILRTPNPPAHSKRHKQRRRRPLHRIKQRPSPSCVR